MSAAPNAAAPITADRGDDAPAPAAKSRMFRKSRPMMPRAEADRQARITAAAWTVLGDRDRLMAFFNADHPELAGRPLDIAIASDDGLVRVERVLADMRAAQAVTP